MIVCSVMCIAMLVIGIDPGIGRCGYGVINHEGNTSTLIDYGCIETSAKLTNSERLAEIFLQLKNLFDQYHPERIGVEELFFSKNVKTAIQVAQARGVILLAIEQIGINPVELTPNQVKQAVTGYGNASKKDIQKMVPLMLKMDHIPKQDDAADALAVALAAAVWKNY